MQYNALAVTMCQIYWKIKRRFYSFLIECKQNFMHCHPCCLVKSNRRRMTFRSKVNTVICFVDWNDFLCCWICRFLKLSIFKFVHNVFTTSHFIETRELKNIIVRKRLQNINQFTTKHGYFRIRISVIECWCSSWHQYLTNGTIDAFRFSDSAYSVHSTAVWCITCYSIEMIYYALEASK